MTEQKHDPIFRELDLSAEARRLWGTKWNAPEMAYEFNERTFYLRTEDSGVYTGHNCGERSTSAVPDWGVPDCMIPDYLDPNAQARDWT